MAILENRTRKYSKKSYIKMFTNAQLSFTSTVNFLTFIVLIVFFINFNLLSIGQSLVDINGVTHKNIINPTKNFIKKSIDMVVNIANFNNLHFENVKLKFENKKLSNALLLSSHIKEENTKLLKTLNIANPEEAQSLKAKLVYYSFSDSDHLAIIAAGKNHGVIDNQIVVSNGYLVGRIITSGENYSKVTLASTYNSRIPVKTSNSELKAILVGGADNTGYLLHLNGENKLEVGELILTSGDGNYYPKNIPVARVTKITSEGAYVHILGDISHIDLVEIIDPSSFEH